MTRKIGTYQQLNLISKPVGTPERIQSVFPAFVEQLRLQQRQIWDTRAALDENTVKFAGCLRINTAAGGPSGMDLQETESLQDVVEGLGTPCWVTVENKERNCLGTEDITCWYEIIVEWSEDSVDYAQTFFMDGTPISEVYELILPR